MQKEKEVFFRFCNLVRRRRQPACPLFSADSSFLLSVLMPTVSSLFPATSRQLSGLLGSHAHTAGMIIAVTALLTLLIGRKIGHLPVVLPSRFYNYLRWTPTPRSPTDAAQVRLRHNGHFAMAVARPALADGALPALRIVQCIFFLRRRFPPIGRSSCLFPESPQC